MASFKNYFNYILKKSRSRLLITSVIALLLTVSTVDVYVYSNWEYHNVTVSFGWVSFILGALCILTPIIELAPYKNRRNIDTLFSLPISKFKMGIAHYLNGIIYIASVFTLCSIYTFLYLLARKNDLNVVHFIPYYFLALLFGIVLYSFTSFAFYQGNTVSDGTIFIIAYSLVLMCVMGVIDLIGFFKDRIQGSYYSAFGPLTGLTRGYSSLIEGNGASFDFTTQRYISFAVWLIIGIASAFGFLYFFAKKKSEDVGEISGSIFGYKVLLPIYGYTLLFMSQEFNVLHLLIVLAMYVGFIIYRRTIKLKKSDYICIIASIIPMVLYPIIC